MSSPQGAVAKRPCFDIIIFRPITCLLLNCYAHVRIADHNMRLQTLHTELSYFITFLSLPQIQKMFCITYFLRQIIIYALDVF